MPSFAVASRLPSIHFLLLCSVFMGTGTALWRGLVSGKPAVFLFVVSGWVVSLCLHEFGHAVVAWRGGDAAIPGSGYLSLDPLRYADPLLSIGLPLIYILLGGFGLPGGAVWINHSAIRTAAWDSAVSAAGPAVNLGFLLVLAGLTRLLPHHETPSDIEAALAVLAFLQGTAIVLNLLPIPGLDGFGIIRPFLPGRVQAASNAMAAGLGFLLVFVVLSVPSVARVIFDAGRAVTMLVGVSPYNILRGYRDLRFF